jgi:uncharacterized protein YdeI (BOF family)
MNGTALRCKKPLMAIGLAFLFCTGFAVTVDQLTAAGPLTAETEVVQTFTGKIMSQNGDRFILRDDTSDIWYHLDDQAQASKYLGKTVQVIGTLDGRNDMIHVRNITEEKS